MSWIKEHPWVVGALIVICAFAFTLSVDHRQDKAAEERLEEALCEANQDTRLNIGGIMTYLRSRRVANPEPDAQRRFEEFEKELVIRLQIPETCVEVLGDRGVNGYTR